MVSKKVSLKTLKKVWELVEQPEADVDETVEVTPDPKVMRRDDDNDQPPPSSGSFSLSSRLVLANRINFQNVSQITKFQRLLI